MIGISFVSNRATGMGQISFALAGAIVGLVSLASAQQPPKPTDRVAWGSAIDGLRIGAVFGSDPSKPTLRVLFQNVGSVQVQHVIIGAESGRGPIYNMKFIATAPDGMEREGVHVSAFGFAGWVQPLSIWLNTGGTHELEFPLTDIVYSPTTVSLDALVQQGYSVRVRLGQTTLGLAW